uniref:Survival of motor neuron-related-splicing factor 30 n=1 Tax=Vitis vinifera TaxID=29760 RepID=A5BUN9_VITVI|nr:hypothetical protein VITISV_037743 [Vitis vinifera]
MTWAFSLGVLDDLTRVCGFYGGAEIDQLYSMTFDIEVALFLGNRWTKHGILRVPKKVRKLLVDDPENSEYVDMEKELEETWRRSSQRTHFVAQKEAALMAEKISVEDCCDFWLKRNYDIGRHFNIDLLISTTILDIGYMDGDGNIDISRASKIINSGNGRLGLKYVRLQVIVLTEELLATAKQSEISLPAFGTNADASPIQHQSGGSSEHLMEPGNNSDHYGKFPIGTKVQAVWSEDGEWYEATIDSLTPDGYYVSYDGWGNKEEVYGIIHSKNRKKYRPQVDPGNVRPIQEEVNALLEAEKEAEATKQAIKRKIAQAAATDFQSRSLPAKLRIEPDDPEDVKIAKRKKIHAFKSKMRFEQLEVTQNKRQNAWQQFQTTKGRAKKLVVGLRPAFGLLSCGLLFPSIWVFLVCFLHAQIGFFSGRKRESIFKSPDDPNGKVGVTGSGKGLTEFQKREKHLHLKGGSADTDD